MTQMNSTEPRKPRSVARAMGRIFGFGIPATAVMTAALAVVFAVAIDGCSSKNKQTSQNVNPSSTSASVAVPSPTPAATPAVVAKKKSTKRPATVTYSDKTSGISFRYPWKYKLLTPDKGDEAKAELAKLPTNYMNASASSIVAVELSNDPVTSFMNVSVVKGISAEQCQQFGMSSPQSSDETPIEPNDESGVSKVSLRGVEFSKADEVTEQLEARYYHHFEPGLDKNTGSCYEFALGISEPPESTNTVDEVARFQQLERIFGTVKIQPEQVQVITASVPEQPVNVTNPQ
ncbi:MAG TPA: hypothetical protein VN679_10670 [Candidatus Acidoferrales bacterium]|nr:hypothetical protein [Candidatus Acidoferrales bacterium]